MDAVLVPRAASSPARRGCMAPCPVERGPRQGGGRCRRAGRPRDITLGWHWKPRAHDNLRQRVERWQALVGIGRQLVAQRETVPLLEHIADQAVQLLGCERASIFLWAQARKELVGRPALGLPNGELRLPDSVGVVGQSLKSGEIVQVDDVRSKPWKPWPVRRLRRCRMSANAKACCPAMRS